MTITFILRFCLLASLLTGCGVMDYNIHRTVDLPADVIAQMNTLYNPLIEKGFCVGSRGVYNVLDGGLMWSEVPLCGQADIVMHTHPFWGEKWANWIDTYAWDQYYARYKGWRFGIMLAPDDFLFYDHK